MRNSVSDTDVADKWQKVCDSRVKYVRNDAALTRYSVVYQL